MTNIVDGIGTTKYTYSAAGQLLTEDGPFASATVTNVYSNRLRTALSLQQPTGVWTNGFAYDSTRRLTNVTSSAGAFGYVYDPTFFTHHASLLTLPNTSYITNVFDANDRLLATYLNKSDNSTFDSYVYVYNPANQRTSLTRKDLSTVGYAYDPIGQLTVADSSVNSEDRGYTYDSAWNLNYRTNNGSLSTFLVDNKNQLTNAFSNPNAYDQNGNLLAANNSHNTYVYDDENRLIQWFHYQVSPASRSSGDQRTDFVYDGLGRLRHRLEYTLTCPGGTGQTGAQPGGAQPDSGGGGDGCLWSLPNETYYFYDGWRVIQERDGTGAPTVSYTRGNDLSGSMEGAGGIGGLLARSSGYSSGSWTTHNYYFADRNGNVTYMLNSSQTMVSSYRYDPFGNTISSSGTLAGANVYRFSSKEIHANSGMYYYLRRFYDPNLQRWINRDPIEEQGGFNLFSFSANDPTERFDPFGMDPPKRFPPKPPGSEDPGRFKPGKDNCLSYGLDCPGGAKQPDGGDGGKNGKDCKELLSQISATYHAQPVPKGGNCPPGTHKIAVFAQGNGGYHIQRQNSDGSWSEMALNDPITYPPRTCQRGSSGTDCGNLCALDSE